MAQLKHTAPRGHRRPSRPASAAPALLLLLACALACSSPAHARELRGALHANPTYLAIKHPTPRLALTWVNNSLYSNIYCC